MNAVKENKKDLDALFGTSPDRELKLSYSRVSDFDRNGPKCLIKRTFVENDGAKIGSITDDLLYTKLVDKKYFDKKQQTKWVEAFVEFIWGQRAQKLYRGDPVTDATVKHAAFDYVEKALGFKKSKYSKIIDAYYEAY